MNILLYIPNITKASGGVYQYSKCLLSILQKDKKNKYFLFLRGNHEEFREYLDTANFTILSEEETSYRSSLFNIFDLVLFNFLSLLEKFKVTVPVVRPSAVDKVIKRYNIDILHSPTQSLPFVNIPKVFTLHDLQELHFPEFFTAEERVNRATGYLYSVYNADKIIVSYQHIKQDIIKYFTVDPLKIEVGLLNMRNLWFEKFLQNKPLEETSFHLPEEFILYPAATWKHKNHVNLLKAIKQLKESHNLIINLVCTGAQTAYFNELEEIIKELGILDQVTFLGKISEEDLYRVYKKTKAIVIPTLYEAGSFPLMEAILMRVPCVCSNVTSLPDTMNHPDYLFDPNNIEDMANKIRKITSDNTYRIKELEHFDNLEKSLTDSNSLEFFSYIYDSVEREGQNKK